MFNKNIARQLRPGGVRLRQKGYVLFTMAATIICICGFAGLVVDVGYSEYIRREAQAAADAGAKEAAFRLAAGNTNSVTTAAKRDTASNGFTDGSNNVTVTVNNPPLSGNYAGSDLYAEVIVTKNISTSFMGILGFPTMSISARSVGGTGPGTGCVFVLDPSANKALTVSGSGLLQTSCGVLVNSSNSDAMDV